uniref:Uncharacterized protein n=1 Tax=Arundo donax TaxID=35708 RepID=A0A0A8YP73_ARUDO
MAGGGRAATLREARPSSMVVGERRDRPPSSMAASSPPPLGPRSRSSYRDIKGSNLFINDNGVAETRRRRCRPVQLVAAVTAHAAAPPSRGQGRGRCTGGRRRRQQHGGRLRRCCLW